MTESSGRGFREGLINLTTANPATLNFLVTIFTAAHCGTQAGHSEGESLRKGEKKRLGRRTSPQNGRFGGRATSCECSEEQTIDQARILGRPDNSLL